MTDGKQRKTRKAKGELAEEAQPKVTANDTPKKTSVKRPAKKLQQPNSMCVVGIGSSAGGLAALNAFFDATPADLGVAYVIVAHQDPNHTSLLPDLLQKRTEIPVKMAEDGARLRPNTIHVIPPGKGLSMVSGSLHLTPLPQPHGKALPINSFFTSLAADQGPKAICIILSGTGTDGTLGAKAIKSEGGLVLAQDEDSAQYDGMPHSLISTGLTDFILPPSEMPAQIKIYVAHSSHTKRQEDVTLSPTDARALQEIFEILRSRTEHDFSQYKKNTICRRIERRMSVHQIDAMCDYAEFIKGNDREAIILFKELLIGVTNFFRDPDAFKALRDHALNDLLQAKPDNAVIRAWVPGCSSGEEVYTLAIILNECIQKAGRPLTVQIFGTDIDEEAISIARSGVYPASIEADIDPTLLSRYFHKEEAGDYRIKRSIREMVVFAPHNVIKDPPFTKLDLISCRNLLIYLASDLQKRLFPLFHYSLLPDGVLLLGSSESVGTAGAEFFDILDKKWKIYTRKATSHRPQPMLPLQTRQDTDSLFRAELPASVRRAEELSALQLVETILQQSEMPPCAVIDNEANVVYIHGRTGRFLEPAEGKASINLLDMARPGLRNELSLAIRKVARHKSEVSLHSVNVHCGDSIISVDVMVKPIKEQAVLHGLMMVIFSETSRVTKSTGAAASISQEDSDQSVEDLKRELFTTRENLQTTIEELETSNEELKSANEELQSTNEELQSTNEELETSKEELQSLNEESATVNSELQGRIEELDQANNDIKNLLDSTEIATVFLDEDLCIRRFTPKLRDIIPLTAVDTGRPISHFASNLVDVHLESYARKVLTDLAVRETEVRTTDERYLMMQIRPYRTAGNVIDGAVITFQDITKQRMQALADLRHLIAVVHNSNDAIIVQDLAGHIQAWNRAAEELYGYTEAEALDMNIHALIPQGVLNAHTNFMKETIDLKPQESQQTTQRITKDGRVIEVKLSAAVLTDATGKAISITTTECEPSPHTQPE